MYDVAYGLYIVVQKIYKYFVFRVYIMSESPIFSEKGDVFEPLENECSKEEFSQLYYSYQYSRQYSDDTYMSEPEELESKEDYNTLSQEDDGDDDDMSEPEQDEEQDEVEEPEQDEEQDEVEEPEQDEVEEPEQDEVEESEQDEVEESEQEQEPEPQNELEYDNVSQEGETEQLATKEEVEVDEVEPRLDKIAKSVDIDNEKLKAKYENLELNKESIRRAVDSIDQNKPKKESIWRRLYNALFC
jgi:hypothetical protein